MEVVDMDLNEKLFAVAHDKLYSAVVCDVLDSLGFPNQAMRNHIRPLDENLVLFGRVRTGMYIEVFHVFEGENPYDTEMDLIDDLKPGEVPVLGCGHSDRITP